MVSSDGRQFETLSNPSNPYKTHTANFPKEPFPKEPFLSDRRKDSDAAKSHVTIEVDLMKDPNDEYTTDEELAGSAKSIRR